MGNICNKLEERKHDKLLQFLAQFGERNATKIRILVNFQHQCKSSFLCCSETWRVTTISTKKVQIFINKRLRRILRFVVRTGSRAYQHQKALEVDKPYIKAQHARLRMQTIRGDGFFSLE